MGEVGRDACDDNHGGRCCFFFSIGTQRVLPCRAMPSSDAIRLYHSVQGGDALDAMRLLMKRYELRTLGSKRAVFLAVINNQAAQKPKDENEEPHILHGEELTKKHQGYAQARCPSKGSSSHCHHGSL